ncbi:hypothetical protein QJQ45_005265 [Haematococcus lacustris]|nr:hypothetical protein QJQ45_005265 [Haematococcus lacustris]
MLLCALIQSKGHSTQSELVVPVTDPTCCLLMAVLDIDSDTPAAFTEVDQKCLEELCSKLGQQFSGSYIAAKAALNMQRIGESRWRPLELCYWPEQTALPAKGKEYPGLGYKRLRDKPPKAQQQQQPVVAQ